MNPLPGKTCANPKGIRSAYTGKPPMIDSSPSRNQLVFEDVSILRIDHFVRVITAIKLVKLSTSLIKYIRLEVVD